MIALTLTLTLAVLVLARLLGVLLYRCMLLTAPAMRLSLPLLASGASPAREVLFAASPAQERICGFAFTVAPKRAGRQRPVPPAVGRWGAAVCEPCQSAHGWGRRRDRRAVAVGYSPRALPLPRPSQRRYLP